MQPTRAHPWIRRRPRHRDQRRRGGKARGEEAAAGPAGQPAHGLLSREHPAHRGAQGGDNVDDFHCPEVEWDWDDGGRSVHQEDCAPLETGAALERRFTANHAYRQAGTYNVKITMRHARARRWPWPPPP